jgi:hypothetical protein
MSIGASIFLMAIGAIIAFGVDANVGWLDLQVVGWVLMVAGAAATLLTLTMWQRRRTVTMVDDRGRQRTIDEVDTPSTETYPR